MKIRYIMPLVILLLIFGFTLNSCKPPFLQDAESKDREIEKPKEEAALTEEKLESELNELDKKIEEEETLEEPAEENIRVNSPLPNQVIKSPLIITGEARGTWFFEADFPVKLLDENGKEIAVHYAQALGDWMTEDFVPFQAEINFEKPGTSTGVLILEKDNPSGLPEHDDELIIPVRFE